MVAGDWRLEDGAARDVVRTATELDGGQKIATRNGLAARLGRALLSRSVMAMG